jgi:hypothetical protein
MKNFFLFLLIFPPIYAFTQTSGGPDAYGYLWYNSNDAMGPAYSWIDITTNGTAVTTLGDDNATSMIPMGMSFHYYYSDFTDIVIGSNGWMSFDNVGNIAHCFPSIPTSGSGDNYVAPFMSDLRIDGAGNPAQVLYYHDALTQQFIISFINVPWWKNTAQGYAGVNTFQVIFSNVDSSITFQYQAVDQVNYLDNSTCASDIGVGIENSTGTIGLQVFQDVLPPATTAFKFEYPDSVLISILDATPAWSMNSTSGGSFHGINSTMDISIDIANVGNTDLTTDINIVSDITFPGSSAFWAKFDTVSNLLSGNSQILNYNGESTPSTTGQYILTSAITNSQDINASNNSLLTEVNFVDLTQPMLTLSYVDGDTRDGGQSWSSGGGMGVYFKPPVYPVLVDSLSFHLDIALKAQYFRTIYDDDGINGAPGTILYSDTVISEPAGTLGWETWKVNSVIQIDSGGFYVSWEDYNGNSLSRTTTSPISRRTYEYLSGNWAQFRNNEDQDMFINAVLSQPCLTLAASASIQDEVSGNDGSVDITVVGGTNSYTFLWNTGATTEDISGLTANTYAVIITDASGCKDTVNATVSFASGFNNISYASDIELYPNPSTGKIHIVTKHLNNAMLFEVFNSVGKRTEFEISRNGNIFEMNLKNTAAGMYIIKGRTRDRTFTKSVIIR